MADEDVPTPVAKPPPAKVFINNVDTYTGAAFSTEFGVGLDSKPSEVIGTLSGGDGPVPEHVSEIVGRGQIETGLKDLIQKARSSNLVVYDLHTADLEEVELMLKAFKRLEKIEVSTTIVLVSSVMVWKKTQVAREEVEDEGEEPADGEEAPPKDTRPSMLSDSDYSKRMAPGKFEHWKTLETLAMALNSKDNLHAYVVCSGIIYGNGEDQNLFLHDMFKSAWLSEKQHRIVGDGKNYIPMVHVRDLAACIKSLSITLPSNKYCICVDEGYLTQSQVVQGIVDEVCEPFSVPNVTETEAILAEHVDVLTLDLRLTPSSIMTDETFVWHSREGLCANISTVADEFCQWRNLRPTRILVTGPPGSGKSAIAAQLAQRYNCEHVKVKDVVDAFLEGDSEEVQAAKESLEESAKKVGAGGSAHMSNELLVPVVRAHLERNVCKTRGFVLDGFPKNNAICKMLFTTPSEDEEPAEDGEEKTELVKHILPEHVIELDVAEDVCRERMLALGDETGGEARLKRRTERYVQENKAQDGSPNIASFFEDIASVTTLTASADTEESETFASSKAAIEAAGRAYNYLATEEELAAPAQQAQAEEQAAVQSAEEQAEQEQISAEQAKRAQMKLEEEQRRSLHAEAEAALLEAQSGPMREYLQKNVVPYLGQGLVRIAKDMPEDPIDYLASFLFYKAQENEAEANSGDAPKQ